ncbi:paraneoplastic antigen Ma3-like [Ptychodera flava]|uniref:paraneoplastic antigen Ma3-like n=1 Tax=Ptychodera flava TaxID=63121 RepID=UPI003969C1E7
MNTIRSLTPAPNLTVRDYLDALEGSYGTRLTPAESLKAFQSCYQKAEWSHSQYLQELQTLLRRAIRQGSVKEYEADYLRLKQFTDGVLYNESHLSSLQLDTKLNQPPGYIELMQMVRKEEARQEEKAKNRAHKGTTPSASTNYTAICDSFEATATSAPVAKQTLDKSDIQQVVQQVMDQMMKGNDNQSPTQPASSNTWSTPTSQQRPRQQNRRKREQNQSQVSTPASTPTPETSTSATESLSSNPAGSDMFKKLNFCFNCGLDGHTEKKCFRKDNPDLQLVKQKFARAFFESKGNYRGHPQ